MSLVSRFLATAALCGLAVAAQAAPQLEPVPEPPPMPEQVSPEEAIVEPTVKSSEREDGSRFDEYSYQNHVYMVKVTPKHGDPYYLVDQQGDGNLVKYQGKTPMLSVPMWMLHRW